MSLCLRSCLLSSWSWYWKSEGRGEEGEAEYRLAVYRDCDTPWPQSPPTPATGHSTARTKNSQTLTQSHVLCSFSSELVICDIILLEGGIWSDVSGESLEAGLKGSLGYYHQWKTKQWKTYRVSKKNWVLPHWAFGDPASSWEEILMIFVTSLEMLNLVKLSFFWDTL